MKSFRYILVVSMLLSVALTASAQVDRHDVRAGNRKFRKDNWKEADISYRKALVKDSTSVAANYNLANTLYRQENYEEAEKLMKKIGDNASASANAADYWYNTGDIAIAKKDWQGAVNAFKEALLKNPSDMDAKENYIYAKKMLENQQKNGGGKGDGQDNQDQNNQDQNKNGQDQNKDQNNDQNNDGQNKDQDQNRNQNQNNGQGNGNQQPPQGQEGKISPQQAQQMLRAIQAKEKETQDKVNKEKADALKSRQKEKNW
ncbi:MAG: tetratricopeptide repeat protein [Bacteroidales bacterium]|nr:tetratricopeptide repeat protein [Bacteroidales bacterium]